MEKVPVKESTYEEIIKKSRFVVKVFPLNNPEEFNDILEACKDPSANHNCWAWKYDNQYRFSDDGEPSGTAGKPIYQALEYQKWNHIAVIIIRYFGGIKLGAGGLIRAYNGSASKALDQTLFTVPVAMKNVQIVAPHNLTGTIFNLLKKYNLLNETIEYDGKTFILNVEVAENSSESFIKSCVDETSGTAVATIIDILKD